MIYGGGGIGKSTLCAALEQIGKRVKFIDIEDSTSEINTNRIDPSPETYQEVRDVLHDESLWVDVDAIVIDSLTKLEELAAAHAVLTIPHEKGHKVNSIEGYGYGKGFTHVYDLTLQLLADLDAHARKGRWIICTAHECTANVPNPAGEDWLRYEPRLQSPPSGKASIRHRVKEWCGHLFFVGYDMVVDNAGKAKGGGTRTIYPQEMPTHWAKSRTVKYPIPYTEGSAELWWQLSEGDDQQELPTPPPVQ